MKLHQCSLRPEHARAVWFVRAMGLLDDAIREHLELKRRRGADPAEVAREQREALAAAPDREARPESGDAAEEPLGEAPQPAAETLASVASGETGSLEETAELDMNAVLEHEPPPESARTGEDDSLEWEVAEQIESQPGPEPREAADAAEEHAGPHGYEEEHDVVGDVPEQERLHFEHGTPGRADTDR